MPEKDQIYSHYQQKVGAFQFDETVAKVFSDMIKRSVPGYEAIITMIGVFTQAHAQSGTCCYDLGCSLGASTLAILGSLQNKNCQVVAVDNSKAMVDRCKQNLAQANLGTDYLVLNQDIRDLCFRPASVVVLNFTLQFIPEDERLDLLKAIYRHLVPGGILIMSEKVRIADEQLNTIHTALHHAFKKAQGYSDLEISQKRTALENVLIPETEQTHCQRLRTAGFSQPQKWFQCLNFTSFYAIK